MYRIIVAITTIVPLFYFSSCRMAEKTDYIFPDDYKGLAIVIFNAKNGEQVIYNEGWAVVKIPSDGILTTKHKRPVGIINNRLRYFIRNASGGLDRVCGPNDEIPHNDSSTPYIVSISSSINFYDTATNSKNEMIASYDLEIFKIVKGEINNTGFNDEVNKYIDSLRPTLIFRANNQ